VRLNVIIPSYNASGTIGATLGSLSAGLRSPTPIYDITVVDSSPDGSVEDIVRSMDFPVNLIRLDERAYPGKARNEGVKRTGGDIIVFIDADAYAGKDWIINIDRYLASHAEVAVVGGPVLNANPKDGYSRLAHWCEFSGYGKGAPEGNRRVLPTVNFAIRREAFLKYGPFLETQFGNEDVLLSKNLCDAGEKIHFSRNISVYHKNKTSLAEIRNHQRILGNSTGRARVQYDLPGSFLTRGPGRFLIPYAKTWFIGWRLFTQEPEEFPWFLIHNLRVFNTILYFLEGFVAGVKEAGKDARD
jgi:GT2 family glycosyltransferase